MNYENTLEKVIIRLDEEDKEKDKRIAELEKTCKSRSDTIIEYSIKIAELEKEVKGLKVALALPTSNATP